MVDQSNSIPSEDITSFGMSGFGDGSKLHDVEEQHGTQRGASGIKLKGQHHLSEYSQKYNKSAHFLKQESSHTPVQNNGRNRNCNLGESYPREGRNNTSGSYIAGNRDNSEVLQVTADNNDSKYTDKRKSKENMASSKSIPIVANKTPLGLEIRSNINIDTQRYLVIRTHLPNGVTFEMKTREGNKIVIASEASMDGELNMTTYYHQQERPAHELTERYLCTGRAILYIDNDFEQIELVCLKSTYTDCPHHEGCCRMMFTDGNSYILKSREIDIFVSEMISIRYGSENSYTSNPTHSDSIREGTMSVVHDVDDAIQITEYVTTEPNFASRRRHRRESRADTGQNNTTVSFFHPLRCVFKRLRKWRQKQVVDDSKQRILAKAPVLIRRSKHYNKPERRRPTVDK